MKKETPLQKAERVLGGRGKLAELCPSSHKRGQHVSVSAVQLWHVNGIPAKHAPRIAAATRDAGDEVTLEELVPHSFDKPKPRRLPKEARA